MRSWSSQIKLEIQVARKETLDEHWNSGVIEKRYHVIPHSRLYLPLSGEGEIRYGDQCFFLRPGRMLLVPALSVASFVCHNQLVKYWLHFTATIGNDNRDIFSLRDECLEYEIPPEQQPVMIGLFKRIADSFDWPRNQVSELDAFVAVSALSVLLEPFFRQALGEEADYELPKILELISYMQRNLNRQVSMAELGKVAGLHPNYLSRLFRNRMGLPPIAYMQFLRMRHASALLQNRQQTESEIAEEVGFSGVTSFSKAFRRYCGLSPRDYCRRNEKKRAGKN